jgi:hypothetical protein
VESRKIFEKSCFQVSPEVGKKAGIDRGAGKISRIDLSASGKKIDYCNINHICPSAWHPTGKPGFFPANL